MPLEEALVERMVDLGSAAGDRVSWFLAARGDAPPRIVLSKVAVGEEWTHDGPDGLDRPLVQMDLYGRSDTDVVALGRAVRAEMREAREVGGVRFHPATLEDESPGGDNGEEEGGEPLFHLRQDYSFYHEEI